MSLFQTIPIKSSKVRLAPIAAKLASFETHKQDLLTKLKIGYQNGPQRQPFDERNSWRDLTMIAQLYFWSEVRRSSSCSAKQIARLRQLEKALRVADGLAVRAMKDEVGDLLYVALLAEKDIKPTAAISLYKDGSSVLTRTAAELINLTASLAKLRAAAHAAAANYKPTKSGRPTLLSRDCIQGLGRVYRASTGSKPGRGAGPFADFVSEFLTAINRSDFAYESVVDAIKDAHRRFKSSFL